MYGGNGVGGERTAIDLSADDHIDVANAGLDNGAVLCVVTHNLVVAALNLVTGDVVPDVGDGVESFELEAC